ncbi:MAG: bifunctional phosphoribosylaminoimidazolecarboxamide formyltransferase/IMP cyclohydrolase [Oscillospiraceae bacterium]|nr:bifunctional phosphoribosylaminoimidazolecarboxamide formyltransferase/IMP cyclohydrolase [Oscillospiraceae bacterium]
MKKRALLSVYDKTGIVDFAKGLQALGYEIVSTGGTGAALKSEGVAVTDISDITGFPECLGGRVKTLHPKIHAGILAMRGNEEHMRELEEIGAERIDIVANNLYPFNATIQQEGVTLEQATENMDIGGPSMLRAAAKNWQDVCVIVDPYDYDEVLEGLKKGGVPKEKRFILARKVFAHTAAYDAAIAGYLNVIPPQDTLPEFLTLTYAKKQHLRYGENPHQKAAFYSEVIPVAGSIAGAEQLHGKELSFCNINDANGALETLRDMYTDRACAVAVKHANPCGAGYGETLLEAYTNAYDADPLSIYGGIVALNREVDVPTAKKLAEIFLEIIIAPSYEKQALEILTKKKNIRLLKLPGLQSGEVSASLDIKKVTGGLLVQERDTLRADENSLKTVTKRAPTAEETEQLDFAWRVVKHVKSNGVLLVKGKKTVGIGPGQTNRVGALEIAVKMAGENSRGSVMASDAFIPFDDGIKAAAAAGITAIIQTGGALRDADTIAACDEAGIAMVFTGARHFKH